MIIKHNLKSVRFLGIMSGLGFFFDFICGRSTCKLCSYC